MTNYNPIADGDYIRNHIQILKDLCIWSQMTREEKAFFQTCRRCKPYSKYSYNKETIAMPCDACASHLTEISVDNKMIALRRKYL